MSDCSAAAAFIEFVPQHVSSAVHVIVCIASIIVNILFIRMFLRDLPCHQNCRMLLLSLVLVNISHSTAYASLLCVHLYKVLASKEPCDILVSAVFCYVMRLITSSSYTAHTTLLTGLIVERVIATKLAATYEKRTVLIGYTILILAILPAILLCCLKQWGFNMQKGYYYCSSLTTETSPKVAVIHMTLFLILLTTVALFGILYISNSRMRKR
ncbi:hypothetical protein Q1695_007589 [Nippostrongylus brasiliensis]|nr:hypothetical protein Q1695_007589 [Nippostrongylus brasiliensis]